MHILLNDIQLYYQKSGRGAPLLLLHGNGEDHRIFEPLCAKLSEHFTVYAIDSRNHGRSGRTQDFGYDAMADDMHQFIQALNLESVYLVGFSDGAIIGLLLAMKQPARVRKMALLGINLCPEDFDEESYRFIKETFEATGDPLFKLMLEQPDIALEALTGVKTPVLLVAGEHDAFRPGLYHEMIKAFPNARLKIMQGHDHSSYIIGQDLLFPDVLTFFSH